MAKQFEGRFEGASNAGLRARIRQQVARVDEGRSAYLSRREAILALAGEIALTGAGMAKLRAVADDYS